MTSVALLSQDGGTALAVLALTGLAERGTCWGRCLCEHQSTFPLFLQRWGWAPAQRSLCQPVPWPGRLCLWLCLWLLPCNTSPGLPGCSMVWRNPWGC